MILHRCFGWNRRAAPDEAGGALWLAREFQGDGRHDNPERYGCLYLAERPEAAVVEQLARFRGNVLVPGMLRRRGLPRQQLIPRCRRAHVLRHVACGRQDLHLSGVRLLTSVRIIW